RRTQEYLMVDCALSGVHHGPRVAVCVVFHSDASRHFFTRRATLSYSRKIWMRIQKNLDFAVTQRVGKRPCSACKLFIFSDLQQVPIDWHSPCAIGARSLKREGPTAFPKPLTHLQETKSMSQTKTKPIKHIGDYNK